MLALKYTGRIGYVQGMNFVVATFLYHACPEISLILFASLMEEYELCSVYQDELKGLDE